MESSYPILFASIIGVIFVITFIMYVYCAAIQNISDNELEEMTLNNERLFKKLNDEKDNPGKLINTVQTLTLAISFVVGIFVEFITKDKYIFLLSGAGFLLFMLVFGEIIPKKIGQRHVKSVIVKLNRIAGTVIIVFMPFTFIV